MAEQLAWRRGFPSRALRRLGWVLTSGAVVAAIAWLLFGSEPNRLASGEPNPLALVPLVTTALVAAATLPALVAMFRRPMVVANHYALTIRPGALRRLVLPWAEVTELVARPVEGEPLLLVRCGGGRTQLGPGPGPAARRLGDPPRWFDRRVLRSAGRDAAFGYDLAVRMDEFAGPARARLGSLAPFVPRHVRFIDELPR